MRAIYGSCWPSSLTSRLRRSRVNTGARATVLYCLSHSCRMLAAGLAADAATLSRDVNREKPSPQACKDPSPDPAR